MRIELTILTPTLFFVDLKYKIVAAFYFLKSAMWKQKKLSWKPSTWFLVTMELFCIHWEYDHNDIMRRLLSDRYKHSLKVGATGKPWVHGSLWQSTYGEMPFRQINKSTDWASLWFMVFAGNYICFELNYWQIHDESVHLLSDNADYCFPSNFCFSRRTKFSLLSNISIRSCVKY